MEDSPKVEPQAKGAERRPVSERKREANRKNALRSTGPKTPRGKSISRLNSLKHGLLAQAVPVRNLHAIGMSEEKEFEHVLRDLAAELQPVGMIEAMLVERMAYCHYQMARIALPCCSDLARS
ncbi:MAG: hypothetical protein LAO30_21015 [Acidobacteriia bacterium]|nr:hypothetical protein [Terriglobia bacterium]